MTQESESAYLERRARRERALASSASDPASRATHGTLADMFEARLNNLPAQQARPGKLKLAY
jgi:hypothetical protein